MKTCAVIPAAGRGSRLGIELPKLLVPVSDRDTIWSVIKRNLKEYVDHIHVVLSPAGAPLFEQAIAEDPDAGMVSTSIQPTPIGMGDAIFRGEGFWSRAESIIVIWGDQVHVSGHTIKASLELHEGASRRVVIPLVSLAEPYVEYRFDLEGRLTDILQSREGDRCQPGGLGDVGTFVLSTTGLSDAWRAFLALSNRGLEPARSTFFPSWHFWTATDGPPDAVSSLIRGKPGESIRPKTWRSFTRSIARPLDLQFICERTPMLGAGSPGTFSPTLG